MTDEETPARAIPPAAGARIAALDVLRGMAVLGILLINIVGLGAILESESSPGHDGGPALGWGPLDQVLWWVSQLFVEGTMRGLFTLLFGAGFIIFCARDVTSSGRTDVGVLYLRRSLLLIVFGALHTLVLFWPGDILLIYGLAAFLLFPFRRARARTLMVAATALLVALSAWSYVGAAIDRPEALREVASGATLPGTSVLDRIDHEQWAEEIVARHGGWLTNAAYFRDIFFEWTFDIETLWWVLDALALMLLGAALFRLRVITGERSMAFYVRLALVGYAIGLPLNGLETASFITADFSPAVIWPKATYQASRLATTLGHLGLILAVLKSGAAAPAFRALAQTGRMALTNYLGQSAIAAIVFSGFGLGLFAKFDRAGLWAVAAAIWIVEIAFSVWWLKRFRMGPVEWLWRAGTYGAPPPLRC